MDSGYHLRKRQRARRDESAFATLVAGAASNNKIGAIGANILDVFELPANAKIGVKVSVALTVGQLVMDITGPNARDVSVPALAANTMKVLGYFEKGTSFGMHSAVAGVVSFYLITNIGSAKYLGKATVS